MELPQVVALVAEQNQVTLRFTQPVNKNDWEFATAVETLLGKRPNAGLTLLNNSEEE